jgi:protein pelota
MKILNFHKSTAKLQVENLDDLWYLSSIIDAGDTVEGKTFRKVKVGGTEENKDAVKKPVFLSLAVEKVEFHKYSDILRVSGKVLEGKEDIPKGSYHTFNVEPDTVITLVKPEWLKYQRMKLEESAKEKKPETLICVFDREEAIVALMKKYGFDVIAELKGEVEKKADVRQSSKNFYDEIIKNLQEYVKRHGIRHIILASPAFWKEELFKNLKDQDLKRMIVQATCSSVDRNSINEVLKRPEVQSVLQEERASSEMKLVEELFSGISKDSAVSYGIKDTENAVNSGAVKTLLVTDGMIQKNRQDGSFEKINNIMRLADRSGAQVHIISSDHDGGRRLDGLGGIGALLRYKIN